MCKFAGLQVLTFCLIFSVLVIPVSQVSAIAEEIQPVKVLDEQKKAETSSAVDMDANDTDEKQNAGTKDADKGKVAETQTSGMSTTTKVVIGVGAVALVGLAMAAGGSSGGGTPDPVYPTSEILTGVWNSQGTRLDGGSSYSGVYTLNNYDTHSYDLTGNTGKRITGNGTWYLEPESYSLTINNDTGSTYKGDFVNEDYSTITLTTTDGRWRVVLTR